MTNFLYKLHLLIIIFRKIIRYRKRIQEAIDFNSNPILVGVQLSIISSIIKECEASIKTMIDKFVGAR